jgi:hypothetical protein
VCFPPPHPSVHVIVMGDSVDHMRALLSSYYGMVDEDTAEEDAMDVDSSTFDAVAYVKELLTEKSLPELTAYDATLRQETRSLDSAMQNLVYENYNKFISATDTVGVRLLGERALLGVESRVSPSLPSFRFGK